jgi:hypothetical protein
MREVESGGNSSHWVRKSKMAAARYLLSSEEQLGREVLPMREVESGGNSSHWVRKIQDGGRQILTELGRAAGRGVQLEGHPGEGRPSRPRGRLNKLISQREAVSVS